MENFQKQVSILNCKNEELEQHGRRCCLKIEGVPSVENQSSGDVLGKVKTLITESGCEILDVVIHRAHPIDRGYKTRNMADKVGNVPCQSIIVRFLTFQHRTLFYQNRNKLKHVKVRLHTVQDIYRSQWLCESIQKC